MRKLVRRGNVVGPAWAWWLTGAVYSAGEVAWNVPIFWPAAVTVMDRLDAALVARGVWTVDKAPT